MEKPDVIVVGAGLAGAAATLKLSKAGRRVRLIEARSRCGGRAYVKPYGGDGPELEFGGAWITPWHHRLRALVSEHGLTLRPRHPITNRLRLCDVAKSYLDTVAHERAIARVAADAILLKKGITTNERGEALTEISFHDYLDRLQCPAATRAVFSAWWAVSGNGDHRELAASEFLSSCAYGNGLAESMISFWADTVVPGMGILAERMIAASRGEGTEAIFSDPVTHVAQDDQGVAVTTGTATHRAPACVLALGINQLQPIRFTPDLPLGKGKAIALGHGGRSFKLWIRVEGVPVGTLVTGDGSGIEFAFAERPGPNGSTYVVAFGLMNETNQPGDEGWVRTQAARLFPNARVLSYDWHNWVDDPLARGTWVAAFVGHEAGYEAANWQLEGRIAFASSDYAPEQAGWFEGAVIAGEQAAGAVLSTM